MNLLLDSHTFLWFVWDDPNLSPTAKTLIEDPANQKFVSVATCWEIAIKAGLKKLALGEPATTFLPRELADERVRSAGDRVGSCDVREDVAAAPQRPVRPPAGSSGDDREAPAGQWASRGLTPGDHAGAGDMLNRVVSEVRCIPVELGDWLSGFVPEKQGGWPLRPDSCAEGWGG